jgi:hypothetical protein
VQVRHDDVLHGVGLDVERREPAGNRLEQLPAALAGHAVVEPGVHHERPAGTGDHPDEVGERLQDVVRVAAEEILRRPPVVVRVPDGIDLVDVVSQTAGLASRDPAR